MEESGESNHHSYGSNSSTPELQPRQTVGTLGHYGRFRLVADLEPIEVTFTLFAFVSIVGAAIITIVRISESKAGDFDFTFAVLLLLNLVFILYYTFHGVFCERPFELVVSIVATLVVMLYCIVEYAIKGKDDGSLKLGRLIVVCLLGPVDIALGFVIALRYFKSRSLIFRTVGGNAVLQTMCQTMFLFTAMLKLDFQIVLSLLVLVLNNNNIELSLVEILVIGIGVPLSLGWVILGFIMVRFELIKLSTIFWLIGLCEPAYIVFLFVRQGTTKSNPRDETLDICIIAAGVIGLIIRASLYLLSVLVTRNFKKGLKEKVYGHQVNMSEQT